MRGKNPNPKRSVECLFNIPMPATKTEQQPEMLLARADDSESDSDTKHPQNRFKCVHGQEIVHGQIDGAQEHGRAREHLRVSASAELADDPTCKKYLRTGRKCREKSARSAVNRRITFATNRATMATNGGLVHISPG